MSLENLPDISFVETNPETIISNIINDYENAYFESFGVRKTLAPGDPIRVFLYTQALREIILRGLIDETAKQNFLKYAKGDVLDHLGARARTPRGKGKAAGTRELLKFSQAQSVPTYIPKGTRFSPGTNIYFETDQIYELPAGNQELMVNLIASEEGSKANGFLPGQINVIVDPLPFLVEATNIETTNWGEDVEDDERYRERIYLAPEGLSVAGPEAAYIYYTKSYSSLIEDVKVTNPSDAVVDIRVILKGGELPTETFLEGLNNYFGKNIRPLTDRVNAKAPNIVSYDLDVTYYIPSVEIENIMTIQEKVQSAYNDYIIWQKSKIGRDINPSELIYKLIKAGAKRVDVRSPVYVDVNETDLAIVNTSSLVYGGLEDD